MSNSRLINSLGTVESQDDYSCGKCLLLPSEEAKITRRERLNGKPALHETIEVARLTIFAVLSFPRIQFAFGLWKSNLNPKSGFATSQHAKGSTARYALTPSQARALGAKTPFCKWV